MHFKSARGTQSRDYRRGKDVDLRLGVFLHFFLDLLGEFLDGLVAAFPPGFEYDGELAAAALVAAHPRTAAVDIEHVVHLGKAHQVGYGALGNLPGAFQGGTFGQFKFDAEIALVFLRHETGGDPPVHRYDGDQSHPEPQPHAP